MNVFNYRTQGFTGGREAIIKAYRHNDQFINIYVMQSKFYVKFKLSLDTVNCERNLDNL